MTIAEASSQNIKIPGVVISNACEPSTTSEPLFVERCPSVGEMSDSLSVKIKGKRNYTNNFE